MTNRPKFCNNSGELLDQENKKCSKCGFDFQQQQVESSTSNTSIVD
jgi:predicted Zn-ribbon and HTH transcriptional regulator